MLRMGVERAALGELLFRPSEAGIAQQGLGEGLLGLWAGLAANQRNVEDGQRLLWEVASSVVLVGGGARIPGLRERLEAELRAGLPCDIPVRVEVPEHPDEAAWRGAAAMATSPEARNGLVTREMYQEMGYDYAARYWAPFQ